MIIAQLMLAGIDIFALVVAVFWWFRCTPSPPSRCLSSFNSRARNPSSRIHTCIGRGSCNRSGDSRGNDIVSPDVHLIFM
jgi:hypothetical protein